MRGRPPHAERLGGIRDANEAPLAIEQQQAQRVVDAADLVLRKPRVLHSGNDIPFDGTLS